MPITADLHIHSKYSRATSPKLEFPNLEYWAKRKGINVLATGDFTHPAWVAEIKEKLEPKEKGLFRLKDKHRLEKTKKLPGPNPRFILEAEISSIYKKAGETRKIHNNIYAPSIENVEKINKELSKIGNLKSDGRPILGLDARDLLEIILEVSKDNFLIPAHIWTPWFSLFGSKSGFDSIEACFEDLTDQIFAIETGLSSDPPINWRLSMLDDITLVSNSDAHSPFKLGRELNVLDTELSYRAIKKAIQKGKKDSFKETIEFFPQEGRYHYDGHRKCGVRLSPKETAKKNGRCPECGAQVTVGVMNRVEELADRPEGKKPKNTIPFRHLIPLAEIIGEALDVGPKTKTVAKEYKSLIQNLGSEFSILTETPIKEIKKYTKPIVAEGIKRVREEKVHIKPGYDGEYGEIKIFTDKEREEAQAQQRLL